MKKRILHILNSTTYSGAENVVFSIIQHLNGYEFAYVSRKGEIQKKLEIYGITYYLVDKLTVKEIKRCILDFKPDIIHAHDFTASILSSFLNFKIPVISHLHNNPPWIKRYGIKSFLYRFTLGRYKEILLVSEAILAEYVFRKKLEQKAVVVYNPVDFNKIKSMAQQKQNCVEKYDIINLGRLSEQKNPKLFIKIIEECIKNKLPIKAAMIGNGELYDDVKAYIYEKHMEEHIFLLGFKDNPYIYLQQSKILCIPSLWEGFGMAAVEALVLGKPVISSCMGGLPGIVNNSCGKVCYSKKEYVEEIVKLILDKEYYKQKSIGAVKRAEDLYQKIDYYNNIMQLYQKLL